MAAPDYYSKLTMNSHDLILQDLLKEPSTRPAQILHNENESLKQQIQFLLHQIRRAKSTSNRVEILLNAWHLGEILEKKTSSPSE